MGERTWQDWRKLRDYFFIGIFVLGVIVLRLFYITRTSGPFIYADEFGYWSHAAHMTGNTWAGVMDGVSWYSFGYSFWLALTFLFSHHMETMFHIAILINILMSLGTFALVYRIIRKLVGRLDTVTCGFIALAVTSFPTYIFYSYTTMAETLAALVVWLLFYEMISLEEKPAWWKGALLGITAGYAYMVHNRLLTAVLAVIVCLAVLWIMRKIDWKIIVSFGAAILVMFLAYALMKGCLEAMIVANQTVTDTGTAITRGSQNTFSSVTKKIVKILSLENIKKPFLSVMGQLWQCLSATYLLAGLGIVYCALNLKRNMALRHNLCIYAYPILAVLFSVGLTGVVAYGPAARTTGRVRIDPAFYGRYSECYFPMIVMMALVVLFEMELRGALKLYLGVVVVYLCLSVGMFFRLYGIEEGYINIVSAVSIHVFHWLGEFSVWKCCLVALFCSGVIVGLCHFKRLGKLGYYSGLLVLLFLFSTTTLYCMRMSIRGENDYTNQYTPIYDYLNQNTDKGDIVYTCTENKPAFDLQTRLVDKAVVCAVPDQIDEIGGGAYVVVREDQMEEMNVTDYDVCIECNGYFVIQLRE